MSKDDEDTISHDYMMFHNDGSFVEPAKVYHKSSECPGAFARIDSEYVRWRDEAGILCLQKGEESTGSSVSVGASKKYSAGYDNIDWGN